ncbi:MAG: sulfatase-like hydrolase/transferase, partial [Chloroflexota bacterium]
FALELEPGLASASLLTLARRLVLVRGKRAVERRLAPEYPLGIPQTLNDLDTYFLLEDLFDGLMNLSASLPPASLAYLHLFPPHSPYAPRAKFMDAFNDGWRPRPKPAAAFRSTVSAEEEEEIQTMRAKYDAYIATVDEDFGRLFDFWQREGILERNYVVLTSDHGEIYERGVWGHTNEYLYEPLVRVPLIVSSPGQTARVDVHAPTSSVDLAPTLLSLTGRVVPPTAEGVLLPGLGGVEDAARAVFAIDTKSSAVRGPIRIATVAVRKGPYKLIAYLGYEGAAEAFQMYDVQNDPEETNELSQSKPETFADLRREIEAKLLQVNAPYQP